MSRKSDKADRQVKQTGLPPGFKSRWSPGTSEKYTVLFIQAPYNQRVYSVRQSPGAFRIAFRKKD